MKHFDEHTLDLFVQRSEQVRPLRRAIQSHLAKCEGCRETVESLREIYEMASDELERLPLKAPDASLVRRDPQTLNVGRDIAAYSRKPLSPFRIPEVRVLFRTHPFVTGVVSVGFLVAATALVSLFLKPSADRNPSYFLYNGQSNKLEIYSKGNNLLWFLPSKGVRQSEEDDLQSGYTHVLVTDVNGDGKNEVISVIPPAGEDNPLWDALGIYSYDGQNIATTRLSHPIRYQGRSYPSSTQLLCVYADRFGSSDEKLIAVEGQTGRSPIVISIANGRGDIQGEYWHFGNLPLSKKLTDSLTHRPLLVLTGSNDCDDEKNGAFPILVVLDPGAIKGQTESQVTRGFGYAASSSEVFYIRLPRPELEVEVHSKPRIQGLRIRDSEKRKVVQVSIGGPALHPSRPLFEYTFDDSFRLLTVTTDDPTKQLYHQLRASGKTDKNVDEAYLGELGSRVRYWNGREWTKEVTRLRP